MIHRLNQHILFRYFVSGSTSACVDLLILYILHYLFGLQYLVAAILAFIVAFWVSFVLHKFWTFQNHSLYKVERQVGMYFASSLFGLSANTLFMYVFVSLFGIGVILSQVFVGIIVACMTFFISRHVVFKVVP